VKDDDLSGKIREPDLLPGRVFQFELSGGRKFFPAFTSLVLGVSSHEKAKRPHNRNAKDYDHLDRVFAFLQENPYNLNMSHALLLNASFEPLHIVSWQRAIQLLFQGKVEVVEESDREIRTVRLTMRAPAVLRLLRFIPLGGARKLLRFSRANVFLRDSYTCQYCGVRFSKSHLTLDHVIPVVQGGGKSWENIVTSCKPCNQRKGGNTPGQAGFKLIRKPREPRWLPMTQLQFGISVVPERWKIYLRLDIGPGHESGS
jgi:5-methylcytosine-specific restriction endonuclease McrA